MPAPSSACCACDAVNGWLPPAPCRLLAATFLEVADGAVVVGQGLSSPRLARPARHRVRRRQQFAFELGGGEFASTASFSGCSSDAFCRSPDACTTGAGPLELVNH